MQNHKHTKITTSNLSDANQLLRQKEYAKSIVYYDAALKTSPKLKSSILFNKNMALNAIKKKNAIKVEIKPLNDLIHTSKTEWKSIGCDPYFLIETNQPINKDEWFIFQLAITTPAPKDIIKIYIDYGSDFNEDDSLTINYNSNSLCTRIIKSKSKINRLRLDPCETEGILKFLHLDIHKISETEAIQLMKCHLQSIKKLIHKKNSITTQNITEDYSSHIKNELNNDYQDWIEYIETPSRPSNKEIIEHISKFTNNPLISVITPTYNSNTTHLRACIDSVLKQSYNKWELIIVDDCSQDLLVKEFLAKVKGIDPRIKVIFRTKNGHISAASNTALECATGEFIALLDHDDEIASDALYYAAKAINENPKLNLIYIDEDKIDYEGNRFNPHFKSRWNPDLLLSQNYICHLSIIKKDLVTKVNGFSIGLEGSQDHDLLLKCSKYLDNNNVAHIAKILYHWRATEGSTALNANEKTYTSSTGIKAIQNYFKDNSINGAKVKHGLAPNTYHVLWPIPKPEPLVTLIIPTRDRQEITKTAVDSILEKTDYSNYEIIIMDNGSIEEKTIKWFKEIVKHPKIKIIPYNHPFNYSAINNYGVSQAQGEIIGLINNDVEVINAEWLSEMTSHAIRPEIGCVGAKLYYSNNTIQHGGVIINLGGVAGHSHKHYAKSNTGYHHRLILTQNLSAVTAACLLVRKSVYLRAGGLNENDLTVAFNDVDFCLKVKSLGLRNLWTPFAELYHHESISRGTEDNPEKIERFNKEVRYMKSIWKTDKQVDPYYNPNLTKHREDFSII